MPNARAYWRLGLSIPRAVGNAVQRHALKRQLREAFRLSQHDLPELDTEGFDLVLAARQHKPLESDQYRAILQSLAKSLRDEWRRKRSDQA
ncbi:hypothetical protein PHYC_03436 [Phycisphaerales bacterium]|nr:hypothetical protein PHYC_03436 [Phycisphaerales bacterium]